MSVVNRAPRPHERIISILLARHPEYQRTSFKKNVRRAIIKDGNGKEAVDLEISNFSKIPDLYFIDSTQRIITVVEVEHTSKVDDAKLRAYVDLWWAIDEFYWYLDLVVVDVCGVGRRAFMIPTVYEPAPCVDSLPIAAIFKVEDGIPPCHLESIAEEIK